MLSATGSIAITLSKITMLLLRKTLEGDNQLTSPDAIAFALSLLATALLNLKVLNDGLARHEVIQTVDSFSEIWAAFPRDVGCIFPSPSER